MSSKNKNLPNSQKSLFANYNCMHAQFFCNMSWTDIFDGLLGIWNSRSAFHRYTHLNFESPTSSHTPPKQTVENKHSSHVDPRTKGGIMNAEAKYINVIIYSDLYLCVAPNSARKELISFVQPVWHCSIGKTEMANCGWGSWLRVLSAPAALNAEQETSFS